MEEGVVFALEGAPGAAYLGEGAALVGADGEALGGLGGVGAEESLDVGAGVVGALEEGGGGALGVVGVEVDEVEVEVLMGGLGLEGGDDEGVAAGVEGE